MELASPLHTALYLNCLNRTMQINGVYKTFDETFWSDNFVPILYPVWDSDRDRLETFVRMKDGSTHMNKNKYVRNKRLDNTSGFLISLITHRCLLLRLMRYMKN